MLPVCLSPVSSCLSPFPGAPVEPVRLDLVPGKHRPKQVWGDRPNERPLLARGTPSAGPGTGPTLRERGRKGRQSHELALRSFCSHSGTPSACEPSPSACLASCHTHPPGGLQTHWSRAAEPSPPRQGVGSGHPEQDSRCALCLALPSGEWLENEQGVEEAQQGLWENRTKSQPAAAPPGHQGSPACHEKCL